MQQIHTDQNTTNPHTHTKTNKQYPQTGITETHGWNHWDLETGTTITHNTTERMKEEWKSKSERIEKIWEWKKRESEWEMD